MLAWLGDRPSKCACGLVSTWLMLGCGPEVVPTQSASSTGTTTTTTDQTGVSTGLGSSTLADQSTTIGGDTTGSSSGSTGPGLGPGSDCDILAQECAEGLKCTVTDQFSSPQWTCVPVVEEPVGTGQACTVQESGSGLDDCDVGAVCFGVDSRTLEGTCIDYCTGMSPEPTCEDPDNFCHIPGDASYGMWCFFACDPRQQNCPPDQACIEFSGSGAFGCTFNFLRDGAVAEPCEFAITCNPGLACIDPSLVPGCTEPAGGCCSSFCTVGDDTPCLPGQQCVPWFDQYLPHPSYEDLGVCVG